METIDRLVATESIRNLISRYCIEADRGRVEALTSLFAEDAIYIFGGREYIARQGIVDMFAESRKRLMAADIRTRAWHMVTSSAIDIAGDTATARTYVLVLAEGIVDHYGHYDDEFRRTGDQWLISRREFTLQGAVPGGIGEVLK
ncbi:nuclear transport factor 2 family protein [Mycolicibacterium vaccae]|uniref:nuclear transport factor 2 family protein n=1 Tax=Mycolicibacterium vaccae TaxID=1810 RepID=UPI003D095022